LLPFRKNKKGYSMKKKFLCAITATLLIAMAAYSQSSRSFAGFGFKDAENLILGLNGDVGIRRIGPAELCPSDGGSNCNGIISQSVFVNPAYTNATTTFSNVTGLALPVNPSENYNWVCRITWQGTANTTGPKYQFTGPASPTAVAVGLHSPVTASTFITASAVAFSSAVANSGTVTAATNFTDIISLGLLNGVNAGTVQLQAAANGVGTLTIQPGSACSVE
jgi:hypothetical protein